MFTTPVLGVCKIDQTWPIWRQTAAGCALRRNGKARLNRKEDFYNAKLTKHGRSDANGLGIRFVATGRLPEQKYYNGRLIDFKSASPLGQGV